MWTFNYKGLFIHGYCDKNECRVTSLDGETIGRCKSLHAAKLCITNHLQSIQ